VKDVVFHAAMMGGALYRLKCPNCQRQSYLALDLRNSLAPLAVLAIGVVASLPPISDSYHLPPVSLAVARAMIWSVSVLLAYGIFGLAGRFTPLDTEPNVSLRSYVRSRAVTWAFQLAMLYWMYRVFRGLMGKP
jgi:hypothetical protein